MEDTLHNLGILLIESIPTVLFFIFLTFYLKAVLFRPLARIMEERRKATEGVRELAQRAFEAADKKNAEWEYALQLVRAELHGQHEAKRREWVEEQERTIAAARADADRQITEARLQIASEVEKTQAQLEMQVQTLGQRIVESLLRRRAA